MISEKMKMLVKNNSVIREMFEEGKKLAKTYGEENVYDFSLGNPSVPAPKEINETIKKIVDSEDSCKVHGYMSNSGFEDVRGKIAGSLNKRFNTDFTSNNIIMTVGAASGLNIVLKSILNQDEEVIVFTPYFMEYKNYINNYDGKVVEVKCKEPNFEPNLDEFERKITPKTRAVIINTPNNPTGAIYSEEVLKSLSDIMVKKEKEFNNTIFLISDEPYRELVYDDTVVPYVTKFYNNTFVVYSYSKSLSLPGERIGYVVVPDEMEDSENVFAAVTIANRVIGCVNAPALMQKVIGECVDLKVDVSEYKKNRDLLYNGLKELNFECVYPQGAFYLFVKSPISDDKEFCNIAKKYNILVVPGSAFSYPRYVRISYCVSNDMIKRSLKAFENLAEEVFGKKYNKT
ncbi:MAG: pyridoxal phosphate-dependent aminotransferase [Clostridia bacterium]|nr:pyridoxal phosphate-dependent aminotransferase [Clostridia bacterium]